MRDNIIITPEYILVHIIEGPGKNIQIPRLPGGVVALHPIKFWYDAVHGKCAYLKQFALTLAYARTDYKVQGSNDVAWCSTRHLKTTTRTIGVRIAICPTFTGAFARHGLHSQAL